MVDITKCKGVEGAKKCETCYLKTSEPVANQAYYAHPPIIHPHNKYAKCHWYIDNATWQDPQRDKAIAQNGNTGEHYE